MKTVTAAFPFLAIAFVAGIAHADAILCHATEKGSDKIIAKAEAASLTKCTLELSKKVKESPFCDKRKGEKHELLNHSNKTIMGNQVKPSKLTVTCPK